MTTPIRLVIVDDHPLVLDGLEQLLGAESDLDLIGRCSSTREAISTVLERNPDVLVLDLRMPDGGGLAVIRALREAGAATPVVLLTAALDEEDVLAAMRLGVRGVVLKEMASRFLLQCIRKVAAGGEWIEKTSIARALDHVLRREAAMEQLAVRLTPREMEVVRMVVAGHRNRSIAEALHITEGTVKIHLHSIYEKLGVEGRVQLVIYAQERGLA